jgi:hypothetical protein
MISRVTSWWVSGSGFHRGPQPGLKGLLPGPNKPAAAAAASHQQRYFWIMESKQLSVLIIRRQRWSLRKLSWSWKLIGAMSLLCPFSSQQFKL